MEEMRMDRKLDNLLFILDEEIEKKCFEIKRKRSEEMLTKLFILSCGLFITVPIALVFAGVNLLGAFVPILLFLVFSMFALSPIILNNNFGGAKH
jgi:hypothetical protein